MRTLIWLLALLLLPCAALGESESLAGGIAVHPDDPWTAWYAACVPVYDAPEADAAQTGWLFHHTPVQIVEKSGDYVRIEAEGVTGWLTRDYLHLGDEITQWDQSTMLAVALEENGAEYSPLIAEPGSDVEVGEVSVHWLLTPVYMTMNGDWMPLPSPEAFDERFGKYVNQIRMVTIAPEREGARELTAHLLKKGIKVQSGHTDATYEEAQEGFGWGIDSQCHTFNAARGIHHREPGVVTAALLNKNVYCEVICDFKHLHPAAVELIYRMKGPEKMEIISDSVAVTGLPDGEHVINGRKYLIVDGTQRVKGGNTLSGGACYLDGAVRNLISIGIPSEDVFRMASRTPAERLGLERIGRIKPGCEAQLAAWDEKWRCRFTIIRGEVYENRQA